MYVISDLHAHHDNIRGYTSRPFSSVEEMDRKMKSRWNSIVDENDSVLFLGDVAVAHPGKAVEYAEELNGSMTLIRGNHDGLNLRQTPFAVLNSAYITKRVNGEEYDFWCSHWPSNYVEETNRDDNRTQPKESQPPEWFDGWQIHGHVHNNDLEAFPFINPQKKRVNVGAELLEYQPLSLGRLAHIIDQGKRYETVHDVPDSIYTVHRI